MSINTEIRNKKFKNVIQNIYFMEIQETLCFLFILTHFKKKKNYALLDMRTICPDYFAISLARKNTSFWLVNTEYLGDCDPFSGACTHPAATVIRQLRYLMCLAQGVTVNQLWLVYSLFHIFDCNLKRWGKSLCHLSIYHTLKNNIK